MHEEKTTPVVRIMNVHYEYNADQHVRFPKIKFGISNIPRPETPVIVDAIIRGFNHLYIEPELAERCMNAIEKTMKEESGKKFNYPFAIINNGFAPPEEEVIRFFAWAGDALKIAINVYTEKNGTTPFRKYVPQKRDSPFISVADVLKRIPQK
jgi:hypothetical protein